jgi:hypothetical protein
VVYGPAHLKAATGQRVADPGATWQWVQRAHGDAPEALGFTPLEFYPAGRYRVSARVRLEAAGVSPATPLARLRVVPQQTGVGDALREITAADALPGGGFSAVTLDFDNPRWQALSFVVDYLGAGGVALDTITVTAIR